jgi:hypothetical protein
MQRAKYKDYNVNQKYFNKNGINAIRNIEIIIWQAMICFERVRYQAEYRHKMLHGIFP